MELTLKNRLHPGLSVSLVAVLLSACSATSDINGTGLGTTQQAPLASAPAANQSVTNAETTGGNETPTDTETPDDSASTDNATTDESDSIASPVISGAAPEQSSNTDSQTVEYQPIVDSTLVANAASVSCDAALESFRDTMVAMVNESRQSPRQCGDSAAPATGLVKWNDALATAAVNHANDMVTVNFFSHTGSDGLSVADRAESAGYVWRAVGENIAAGQRDIAEVHQGWLDSAGHCRNIMNALYTEIGAACITNSATDFGSYWVVVFGDQR